MRSRTVASFAALAIVFAAACRDDPPAPEPAALAPQFAPAEEVTGSSPAPAAPAQPAAPGTTAAVPHSSGAVPPANDRAVAGGPAGVPQASATDPSGDVTPAVGEASPAWADLAGAELRQEADGFELRVAFAGPAPDRAPDDEHTMNVAAFFDVDGDGAIDYEVWANLATGGWGGAWYDDTAGTARFVDDSGVAVATSAGALVLRFPVGHVGGASAFRWSLASEWGRHATIGTVASARDDAPDEDAAVAFPG